MELFKTFADKYLFWFSIPQVTFIDLLEMFILSYLIYQVLKWIQNTRAWMLAKGIIVLVLFVFFASVFQMNTILWIANKTINVGIISMIIVFQPEFRRVLEQLGRKNFFNSFFSVDSLKGPDERYSDKTIHDIIRAVFEMGKVETGALIVIEQDIVLSEYERTGIRLDAVLSAQLLINIFEHNTPLHDGAIIVRGNRIVSATCYLPLSDNNSISKDLGTRHRAAIGISEVSDALTIVVSEETGAVSVAGGGELIRNVNADYLKFKLNNIQKKIVEGKKFQFWKGWGKSEK